MTDEINRDEIDAAELESMKTLARGMGIQFHPAIGSTKLAAKIAEAQKEGGQAEETETPPTISANKPIKETAAAYKRRKKAEATKLIRCNITCMNPSKTEYQGEIFTVGNSLIGSIRKFVAYGQDYHVPQIILNMLLERQYQAFVNVKDSSGNMTKKGKLVKEFAINILPALTESELKDLAQRQAMAAGTAAA